MKMNHLLMAGVILASGLSVASLSSEGVSAATNSVNTTGDVTFKEDTTPVGPVDPTDPNKPTDPINPVTPTNGPLSIDYASSFNFGEQKISTKDETYYASFDKVKEHTANTSLTRTRPNWVQVTDKRGTNAGWKLQVQQGAQFSTKVSSSTNGGSLKELKGAQIKIKNGTVATTTDNKATAPTASTEITLIPGTLTQAGAAQDVMTAQSNQGMGTWVDAFGSSTTGDKSISLSIPGVSEKVKDAKYTTQLTWLLNDTPA